MLLDTMARAGVCGLSMSPPCGEVAMLTEEDKFQERKRDILVLVMRFLADYNFLHTYQSLCAEASMTLEQVDAADNIDLMTIVQEFVDYYHSKFGRYPKLIRHNYPPPVTYQMQHMPSQQLPQASMQEMHALQVAAAAAATAAAAKVRQQQQQQQQQAMPLAAGPQLVLAQPMMVSQPPAALSVAMSATLPVVSQPTAMQVPMSQPPAALQVPMSAPLPAASDCSMPLAAALSHPGAATQQQQQAMQQQQQQQPVVMQHPAIGFVQHTSKLGGSQALDQAGFVAAMSEALPNELPSRHLHFKLPMRPKSVIAKRSDKFKASDLQEEIMYALVGCTDVGWSSRNVTQETRDFLQKHYSIEKSTISTFFKNRSQRRPYNNTSGSGSGGEEKRREKGSAAAGGAGAGAGGAGATSRSVSRSSSTGTAAQNNARRSKARGAAAAAAAAAGGAGPAAAVDYSDAAAAAAVPRLGLGGGGGGSCMTTAAAAAAMASAAMPDGGYGGLEGMGGFSLTGLSPATSLPACLDNDSYLAAIGSDLDAGGDLGMGEAGGAYCSPCGVQQLMQG